MPAKIDALSAAGSAGVAVAAEELLHGAIRVDAVEEGWVRPSRFVRAQERSLGSVLAWHPGLFRQMARCTAGIAIEFETDSTRISLEARIDELPQGSAAVIADVLRIHPDIPRPYDGFSFDIDGAHKGPVLPASDGRIELRLGKLATASPDELGAAHRVRIWCPCLTGCELGSVSGDGSFIRPVPAREVLLVIGDSIAQGFYAGDPALGWASQLARILDMDLVNQGIGGQVFMPGSLAGLDEAIAPEKIVVELGSNYRFEPCGETPVSRDVRTVLNEIESLFPDTPCWVMTPTWQAEILHPNHPRSCASLVPEILAKSVAPRANMTLVDGQWLMDARVELLADHSDHPSAEGMTQMAQRLSIAISGGASELDLREIALEALVDADSSAFPLFETMRRGYGDVIFADPGCVLAKFGERFHVIWASDRKLARRVMREFGTADGMMVLGENIVRDAERVLGFTEANPCHLVVYESTQMLYAESWHDIRVLDESWADEFLAHYTHPEYLGEGELEKLLSEGRILGGFEDGELVGFIGEHDDGSIGMLEVFPGHRREGWAEALEVAKINDHLEKGFVPWGGIWPGNVASLRLQEKLGLTIYPARDMTFMGMKRS